MEPTTSMSLVMMCGWAIDLCPSSRIDHDSGNDYTQGTPRMPRDRTESNP